ncbi:MAG: DNA mismatch repair endonuclease MutL [Clostridia bacterium]|nr:DNA mismatch repair endonuclease MutL [Clostridia bacterium]
MAKINVLPAKVYNRIAAGEVVNQPYSVVKELVENAIDAGATEIEIFVEKGGLQLIRVVDNGGGIERDDLQSAFLPHATSKIEKAEDLENILTLGFRGEAVASIASVSQMTITSKVAGGKCYSLSSEGGALGEILEAAGAEGTDVKVENLFFNTPVRARFLKSEKGEEAEITTVVARFILNRPNISFTYYLNGKRALQSFGGGDEEAIVGVYGASILQNTYRIDAEKHGVRLRGYIGNQNFYKSNKSYQSVFLNGRHIVNTTISAAISNAYSGYLMKRQYPFYVLHVTVPTEAVDVNVHPNKADVRFADERLIYGCIHSIIAAVLDGNSKALEYVVDAPNAGSPFGGPETKPNEKPIQKPAVTPTGKAAQPQNNAVSENGLKSRGGQNVQSVPPKKSENPLVVPTFTYQDALDEMEKSAPAFMEKKRGLRQDELPFDVPPKSTNPFPNFLSKEAEERMPYSFVEHERALEALEREKSGEDSPKKSEKASSGTKAKSEKPARKMTELERQFPDSRIVPNVLEFNDGTPRANSTTDNSDNSAPEADIFAENKRYLAELDAKAKQNRIDVSSCVYVGKLFNTYLLYERGQEVYIIDQHAAHERLIFNRLREQMQNRNVAQQPMLMPYVLELNAFESAFIRENIDRIREMGFEIDEFGENSYKISAVPADLTEIDLGVFFNDILGDIGGYRAIKLDEILKDKLATSACKAAVKGGMDLTRGEIDALFQLMDGDMGLKCPHGRPVVVKMTKTELEKMFKRIV